ncbi:hypothetical protein ACFLZB_00540 [Nanoarchaeota archaeon]
MKELERKLAPYIYHAPAVRLAHYTKGECSSIVNPVGDQLLVRVRDSNSFRDLRTNRTVISLDHDVEDHINYVNGQHIILSLEDKKTFYDLRTGEEVTRFPYEMCPVVNRVRGQNLVKRMHANSFYDFETKKRVRTIRKRKAMVISDHIVRFGRRNLVLGKKGLVFFDLDTEEVFATNEFPVMPYIHRVGRKYLLQSSHFSIKDHFCYLFDKGESFKLDAKVYGPLFNDQGKLIFQGNNDHFFELFFEKRIRDCPLEKLVKILEKE